MLLQVNEACGQKKASFSLALPALPAGGCFVLHWRSKENEFTSAGFSKLVMGMIKAVLKRKNANFLWNTRKEGFEEKINPGQDKEMFGFK